MSNIEVPREIDSQEILVRVIKSPLHYDQKKKKLSPAAFSPPAGSVEISLLRLKYTDPDFCKKHSQTIINPKADRVETFAGLLLFTANKLMQACEDPEAKPLEEVKKIIKKALAEAKGTPMNDNNPPNYISYELRVFKNDSGLPMHADLIYNLPIVEKGTPNNPINKFARILLKYVTPKYDIDSDPDKWNGDELVIT